MVSLACGYRKEALVSDEDLIEHVVVFIVNPMSGGGKGDALIELVKQRPAIHLFDIRKFIDTENLEIRERLRNALSVSQSTKRCIVFACGGDGTIKWVAEILDSIQSLENTCLVPLPLGTANEFARNTGWASGYTIPKRIDSVLNAAMHGDLVKVDRWRISYDPEQSNDIDESFMEDMLCFHSIGIDAKIAFKFDKRRSTLPSAVLLNKAVYGFYTVKRFFSRHKSVNELASFSIEDRESTLTIPPHYQSVWMLNIRTGADGIDFWRSNQSARNNELAEFIAPSMCDGKLEVFSIHNMKHFADIKFSISHGHRLAQAKSITYQILKKDTPIQIDGEARKLGPGVVNVKHIGHLYVPLGTMSTPSK